MGGEGVGGSGGARTILTVTDMGWVQGSEVEMLQTGTDVCVCVSQSDRNTVKLFVNNYRNIYQHDSCVILNKRVEMERPVVVGQQVKIVCFVICLKGTMTSIHQERQLLN